MTYRLGFTGTRATAGREDEIRRFLDDSIGPAITEFTTGACKGFDSLAFRHLVERFPTANHRLVVPANRSQIDGSLLQFAAALTIPGMVLIEFMGRGTDYRARNNRILDHSDYLIGVADYPEKDGHSQRSGTWMTARLARGREIPVLNWLTLNPEENA